MATPITVRNPNEHFERNISIQYLPFPDEADPNATMKAGEFLFPGFYRLFEVPCKAIGQNPDGTFRVRYETGLEPDEVEPERRDEVIQAKEELEKYYGKGALDPLNESFWRNVKIEIKKKTTYLNMNNPEDKLTYFLIRGGAYKEIATSFEQAIENATPKRWYIINASDYADMDSGDDRKINKAIAALEALEEQKGFDDMFLVHKLLISLDRGVTKKTPKSSIYKDLSKFIHGTIVKTNKKQTAKQFLDAVELVKKDKKRAYVTAYFREANYYNFLTISEDNNFRNLQTGTKYGTTVEAAVSYLSNINNQTELDNIKERIEEKWIQ